jgi:hypothetical protein
MGVQADIQEEVRKETVTKIHRQPTNQDLTIFEKEFIAILANIPTTLGGGNHGHTGIIIEQARYLLMTGEIFTNPANSGTYPEKNPRKCSSRSSSKSRSGTQRICQRVQNFPRCHSSNQRYHPQSSQSRILTQN